MFTRDSRSGRVEIAPLRKSPYQNPAPIPGRKRQILCSGNSLFCPIHTQTLIYIEKWRNVIYCARKKWFYLRATLCASPSKAALICAANSPARHTSWSTGTIPDAQMNTICGPLDQLASLWNHFYA